VNDASGGAAVPRTLGAFGGACNGGGRTGGSGPELPAPEPFAKQRARNDAHKIEEVFE
jgi:hypothetical protein